MIGLVSFIFERLAAGRLVVCWSCWSCLQSADSRGPAAVSAVPRSVWTEPRNGQAMEPHPLFPDTETAVTPEQWADLQNSLQQANLKVPDKVSHKLISEFSELI